MRHCCKGAKLYKHDYNAAKVESQSLYSVFLNILRSIIVRSSKIQHSARLSMYLFSTGRFGGVSSFSGGISEAEKKRSSDTSLACGVSSPE